MVNVPPLVWFVWNCEWMNALLHWKPSSHLKMKTRSKRGRPLRGLAQNLRVANVAPDLARANGDVAIHDQEVVPDLATADVAEVTVMDSTTKRDTVSTWRILTRTQTSATWSGFLASMVRWKKSGWRVPCPASLSSCFDIARTRRMRSARLTASRSADVACASPLPNLEAEIGRAAETGERAETAATFETRDPAGSTRRWSATSAESGATFPGTARTQSTGTSAPRVPAAAVGAATTDQPGTNELFYYRQIENKSVTKSYFKFDVENWLKRSEAKIEAQTALRDVTSTESSKFRFSVLLDAASELATKKTFADGAIRVLNCKRKFFVFLHFSTCQSMLCLSVNIYKTILANR